MEFQKTVRMRRSVRSFRSEQISELELQALLDAAQAAPVAMGDYQTTHITVVQDPAVLEELRAASMMHSSKTGKDIDPYYGAQTLIYISATDVSEDHIEFSNVGCIIENIMLQAAALNLGSVYIWGSLRKLRANKEAMQKLRLPAGYQLLSAVAIGHSTEPLTEREVGERFAVTII